ncbi:uncharacterized protein RJT21DRAFT_25102 [Scheffersomyces amazonensis]|uniref:uncharacterized protein n=1 Tax=Scheffersomyces amazonensis TaxID=1078765 RepID=UPI00315CB2C9
MGLSKQNKEKLIRHLRSEMQAAEVELEKKTEQRAAEVEQKVRRRLNTVSVTLWNVKIKDILNVERHHRTSVKELLYDVDKLRRSSGHKSTIDDVRPNHSVRPINTDSETSSNRDTPGRVTKPYHR